MYYHPTTLTEAQKRHQLAAAQDLSRAWLDGVEQQLQLHTEAVAEMCTTVRRNLDALSEGTHIAHFCVRWWACAVPVSLALLQVSRGPGEMAANVQRRFALPADQPAARPLGSRLGNGSRMATARGTAA